MYMTVEGSSISYVIVYTKPLQVKYTSQINKSNTSQILVKYTGQTDFSPEVHTHFSLCICFGYNQLVITNKKKWL